MLVAGACGGSPTGPTAHAVITAVSPSSGTTFGGTPITITGENFTVGAAVAIGGVPATSVAVVNGSSLTAATPVHAAGAVDVVVTEGAESATLPGAFTFTSPEAVTIAPPVVTAVVAQGLRPGEPAGFADLSESIAVTAAVIPSAGGSAPSYTWTSSVGGTFSGSGATVTWMAPASAPTPQAATLTVVVSQSYTDADARGLPMTRHTQTSGSVDVSLHDSTTEVGNMARQFLLDFSDSTITDVAFVMRNFTTRTDVCPTGRTSETSDVTNNRRTFFITSFVVGAPMVSVNFGAPCAFRARAADACAAVATDWVSSFVDGSGSEHVAGTDQVTAFYVPADSRWWLCDSDYDGHAVTSVLPHPPSR